MVGWAVGFLYSTGAGREIVWDRRGVVCKLLLHGWMDLCDGMRSVRGGLDVDELVERARWIH
jgi:hypothetical protein